MTQEETTQAHVPSGERLRGRPAPSAKADQHVVIDLTDAAVARHGGPVVDVTDGTAVAAPRPGRPRSALLSPVGLLVAVNLLNVLDAGLTVLWIEMGVAVEGNPVVEAIGFPAKIAGVAVGSYVVYRLRPRWLLAPVIALGAVCAYHAVGAALLAGG